MKLNGIEFKSLGEAIEHASLVASDLKVNHYLPFSTDNMILETSKGKIAHIWLHCTVGGVSFRLELTEDNLKLYFWTDYKGWRETQTK